MFDIDEFKSAISAECAVLRHLAGKVRDTALDWRPSPDQRSVQETMQYLAFCGIGPARALLAGDWSGIGPLSESFAGIGPAGFHEAIVGQERELHALLDGLGPGELESRQVKLPWDPDNTVPFGHALYTTSLRFLTAYRMQLFLFLKASGQKNMGFHDAWLGMDQPG